MKTLALWITVAVLSWGTATSDARVRPAAPPSGASSLAALERRIQGAARKVIPCVVAVETGIRQPKRGHYESFASGVLIRADGLILSQYHVSHQSHPTDRNQSRKPGERLRVLLHDGRECEAELLGADRSFDLSLLRIVKPKGPFPHAPLDPKTEAALGAGVLMVGHPQGYRVGRPPVVRFGRVLYREPGMGVSDCRIIGGDSGGPYFDLAGRLVGIIHTGGTNNALGALRPRVPRTAMLASFLTNRTLAERVKGMEAGEVLETAPERASAPAAQVLPAERWSQGRGPVSAFRAAVAAARQSTVAVMDGGEAVALGTVVGSGLVLTKASLLPVGARCRLPDGRVVAAEVLGVDAAFDLALLRVQAAGLRPVEWAEAASLPAGTLLTAPGQGELPLGIGVVSVPRRDLAGPFPTAVTPPRRSPAAWPEVLGNAVQGRGFWVERVEGRAASAGIRPGDVILSLAGTPVRGYADLAACLRGRGAGEQVAVVVSRAGKSLPLTMTLRPDRLQVFEGRRDDFPTVLEHDLPLAGNESGGPLVDRMGKAVGASIAVGPVGGMLIPADCVRRLLPALKSGSVAANWRPAAAAPPSGEQGPLAPVTLTLDGVAQRLRERGSRYQSLLVEYDVALEPHVEPRTLMSWGMPALRGYTERHRTGFAGAKRLADVVVAGPLLHGAPEEEVEPDPNAPPAVAAAVEQARRNAAVRKGRGDAGRLIAVRQPSESRQRFDGRESFQWIEEARRYGRVPPSELSSPVMYLASVGLRPLDPQPTPAQRAAQRRYSFAEGLDRYEKCRVLPQTEAVDGSPCVVLEGEYNQAGDGGRELRGERIWLDPKLGFAPRRWEQRVDGALVATVSHAAFEEAAPGCWLPWESTWTSAAPAWTAPSFRGSPAYSWVMRLRRVRVNDLPDELFRP